MSLPKAQTRWKTIQEAAEFLGLSQGRVRQFIREGRLTASRIGRTIVVHTRDLEEFKKIPRYTGRPIESRRG